MKSGCTKKYAFQNFLGGGGGNGDLEKSRFYWVFLNVGLPYAHWALALKEVIFMPCGHWIFGIFTLERFIYIDKIYIIMLLNSCMYM